MKIIVIVLILGILVDGISASKDARSDLEQSRGFLTNAIGGAINLLTSVGTGIATSIQQAVSNIGNVITQKVNQATQSAGSTINQIIQVHKDVHNKTASTIQNIANEVLHGVNTHVTITKNLTEAVATALANHIKKTMQTTNITLGGVVSIVETVIDAGHKHLEILLKGATNHTAIIVESVGDLVKGLVSALNATKIGQLHHLPNLLLAGVTDILTHLVNSTVSLTKVNSTKILMSAFVKTAGNVVDSLINVLLLVTNKTGNATKHNFGHSTTALLQSFAGLFDNLADITKEILNGTKIILVDKFVNKTDALVQVVSNIADLITDPAISFTESLVDKLNITSTILVDKIHDVFGAIFNISTDAVEKIVDGVHKTVNGTAVTLLSKIPKFQRLVTNTTTKLAAILNDKIKKHNSTLLAIMSKIGNNGTKLMDKSLASIGKMLGNITTGFQNILFTTKNALMNVTKTLGGTITSVAKGVIQLANNVTKKLGDFVAGKLDCAADLLPNVVKTVQGLGNHTVGCAVSKLSHVLGHVVQNTTALAGVTGKVFTGVTDHFDACVKNNSHKSFPQAACLTSFIGTTTNKTSMITEHLADTGAKLVDSIVETGNLTDCLQKTMTNVKDTVIDFATCVLSNTTKSGKSMRYFGKDTPKILAKRPQIPKREAGRVSKEMTFDDAEEILRSFINDPIFEIKFDIDENYELPLRDGIWDIY